MKRGSIVLGALVLIGAASGPALAQPSGSYLASCSRADQRGPFLQAICHDRFGGLVQSRLDLRGCGGGDVTNDNGRLTCSGGGGRGVGRRDDDDRRRREFGRPNEGRDRRVEDDRRGRDDRGREFGRRDRDDDDDRPRRRERREEGERRY